MSQQKNRKWLKNSAQFIGWCGLLGLWGVRNSILSDNYESWLSIPMQILPGLVVLILLIMSIIQQKLIFLMITLCYFGAMLAAPVIWNPWLLPYEWPLIGIGSYLLVVFARSSAKKANWQSFRRQYKIILGFIMTLLILSTNIQIPARLAIAAVSDPITAFRTHINVDSTGNLVEITTKQPLVRNFDLFMNNPKQAAVFTFTRVGPVYLYSFNN